MAAKRSIIRIELDGRAKQTLDELWQRRGMTQIAMMSRMVNWLVAQDDTMQDIVLGTFSDQSTASIARVMLKKLASHDRHS